jgi:hypothetical protein
LAACGALFKASRAASKAPTLTPLSTLVSAIVPSSTTIDDRAKSLAQVCDHTSAPAPLNKRTAAE